MDSKAQAVLLLNGPSGAALHPVCPLLSPSTCPFSLVSVRVCVHLHQQPPARLSTPVYCLLLHLSILTCSPTHPPRTTHPFPLALLSEVLNLWPPAFTAHMLDYMYGPPCLFPVFHQSTHLSVPPSLREVHLSLLVLLFSICLKCCILGPSLPCPANH